MRTGTQTTFTMFAEQLEPEADAGHVHQLVLAAMDALRVAMRHVRRIMPKLIPGGAHHVPWLTGHEARVQAGPLPAG